MHESLPGVSFAFTSEGKVFAIASSLLLLVVSEPNSIIIISSFMIKFFLLVSYNLLISSTASDPALRAKSLFQVSSLKQGTF